MRDALQYPPVRCNLDQIHALADGFADAVHRFNIHLYACDILQDHVHLVPARHRENVEFICRVMKSAATRRLTALGLHPLQNHADATGRAPTPWAEGGWERYLVTPPEIVDAVAYANGNPAKHDLPPQQWDFVRPISWHH